MRASLTWAGLGLDLAVIDAKVNAEDRTRHRRDRVATAAGDGWALDCSAAGGPSISAALSQAAGTLDVAS